MSTSTRKAFAATFLGILALPAVGAQRAYVASTGNDTNVGTGCTLAAPCRSFAAAHTAVDSGGEIVALDAAGYGALTITKSVTLTSNSGFFAGIAASTGNAVTVNAPSAKVILRNLNINGIGATHGVVVQEAATLSLENCVLSGFVAGNASAVWVPTSTAVRVFDTTIRDNTNGLELSGGAAATVARSTFTGNANTGLAVRNASATRTRAYVSDSVFTNPNVGIYARNENAGGLAKIWVTRATVANNQFGIATDGIGGPAVIHIGYSMIVDNAVGYHHNGAGAAIETSNNNIIDGNTDNSETLTYMPLH